MKIQVCRECEYGICTSLPMFKKTCVSFHLVCSKKQKDGHYMECRYIKSCPIKKGIQHD